MELSPYLYFNGACEDAFKFYEKVLGGEIEMMMAHEDSPAENTVPAEWRQKILHASMTIGSKVLMACDVPPGHYQPPQGFSISLNVKDAAEAERVFAALAENGKVTMALAETFWAQRFGMVTDQFGIPWMVNAEKEM
jgi:PhnB protein